MGNLCCRSRKKYNLANIYHKNSISTSNDIIENIINKNPISPNIITEEKNCSQAFCNDKESGEIKLKKELKTEELPKIINIEDEFDNIIIEERIKQTNEEVVNIILSSEEEENLIIEDIFLITINSEKKDNNYLLLEEYLSEQKRSNSRLLFNYNDIDNIMLHLINNETKVNPI